MNTEIMVQRAMCIHFFSRGIIYLMGDKLPCINKKKWVSTKGYSNPCQLSDFYSARPLNKVKHVYKQPFVSLLELQKCENIFRNCETQKIIFAQKFILALSSLAIISFYSVTSILVSLQWHKERKILKYILKSTINLANQYVYQT